MIQFTPMLMNESHAECKLRVESDQRLKPLPRFDQQHDAHVTQWVGINFCLWADQAEINRREERWNQVI